MVAAGAITELRCHPSYTLLPKVRIGGETVRLTPVETDLMTHFMRYPGQAFSARRLLTEVWGYKAGTGATALVRVTIRNLRQKIESDVFRPRYLRTLRRRSLAVLRKEVEPVDGVALARFLPAWQGVGVPRRGPEGLVEVLKRAGDNLTRDNLMKVASNLEFSLPMLLPGVNVKTGPDDFFPIEREKLARFDGKTWEPVGAVMSADPPKAK